MRREGVRAPAPPARQPHPPAAPTPGRPSVASQRRTRSRPSGNSTDTPSPRCGEARAPRAGSALRGQAAPERLSALSAIQSFPGTQIKANGTRALNAGGAGVVPEMPHQVAAARPGETRSPRCRARREGVACPPVSECAHLTLWFLLDVLFSEKSI